MLAKLEERDSVGMSHLPDHDEATTCLIRNDTGDDLPWRGVVGLGPPLILPTDDEDEYLSGFVFVGTLATTPSYSAKWGLTLEPIASGDVGLVRISGIAHCYIDLSPDHVIQFAGPDSSGTVGALVSANCGARVIYRAPGTGPQYGIVVL
jgi:hypothetical protein